MKRKRIKKEVSIVHSLTALWDFPEIKKMNKPEVISQIFRYVTGNFYLYGYNWFEIILQANTKKCLATSATVDHVKEVVFPESKTEIVDWDLSLPKSDSRLIIPIEPCEWSDRIEEGYGLHSFIVQS